MVTRLQMEKPYVLVILAFDISKSAVSSYISFLRF